MKNKILMLAFISLSAVSINSFAGDFKVSQIEIKGEPGLSREAILNKIDLKLGDKVDQGIVTFLTKQLYATGLFHSVGVEYRNNTLIFDLQRLPIIYDITTDGISLIKDADLLKSLAQNSIKKGGFWKSYIPKMLKTSLLHEYDNNGFYDAKVDVEVKKLSRNRVALNLKVDEGKGVTLKKYISQETRAFCPIELRQICLCRKRILWLY